jgi:hypothetical protein
LSIEKNQCCAEINQNNQWFSMATKKGAVSVYYAVRPFGLEVCICF